MEQTNQPEPEIQPGPEAHRPLDETSPKKPNKFLVALVVLVLLLLGTTGYLAYQNYQPRQQLTPVQTSSTDLVAQTPDQKVEEEIKGEKKEDSDQSNYSGKITIAVIGDSMTDLMGPGLPYLKTVLQNYYPRAEFNLLNYGVGAENIEKGLERIKNDYSYKEKHYSSLASVNPDIVIIESFAYNPFENQEAELDRHWLALTRMVDFIKSQTKAQIIISITIAPTKEKFGQGPGGVNWSQDLAWQQANRINQYLENAVRFAQSTGLPLVDVYHQTLLSNGEGNLDYISSHDHIHQNEAGNKLIARLLGRKIFSLALF